MTSSAAARAVTLASLLAIARVAAAGIQVTDPVFRPLFGSYFAPVATNGAVFLALWNNYSPPQVRGSLADASGHLLTPISFLVLPNAVVQDVAASGDNFVMAWSAWPSSYLSLLDANGRIVRQIATLPYFQEAPKIAVSGDRIVVITMTQENPLRRVATIVALDGSSVRSGIDIASSSAPYDVIGTADGFAVGVVGSRSITLTRLSRDGAIADQNSLPLPAGQTYGPIAMASNGTDVFVSWAVQNPTPEPDDRIAWVVFPSASIHTIVPSPPMNVSMVAAFWTGNAYSVVAGRPGFVVNVDSTGEAIASHPAAIDVDGFSGANIGSLVYSTALVDGTNRGSRFRLDDSDGQPESSPISVAAESQYPPGLASNGESFAAAWFAGTAASSRVQAARFTAAGERLDPNGLDAGALIASPGNGVPKVAAGGSAYLVAWFDSNRLLLRRIASNGSLPDPEPIAIPDVQSPPTGIAWNGSRFLVVWGQAGRVAGVFVSPDGAVEPMRYVAPPPPQDEYAIDPSVAWDGNRFLVVWTALRAGIICGECPPTYLGVRAVRVSAAGEVIDAQAAIVDSSAAFPHVTSSGSDFLVVTDSTELPFTTSAYLIRGDAGALYVPKPIAVAQWSSSMQSAVTWDGRDYVIAIQYRLGGAFPTLVDPAWVATIRVSRGGVAYGARVRPSNVYIGPGIAADAAGRIAVSVTETAHDLGAWRVRAYFDPDFEPVPAPPSDPVNVTMSADNDVLVVSWTPTSTNQAGFLIDVCLQEGPSFCIAATAAADATSIRLPNLSRAQRVHVSAANAGGTASAPLIPQVPLRRRAAGR